jgi:Na+-driven multidrug efflux pump
MADRELPPRRWRRWRWIAVGGLLLLINVGAAWHALAPPQQVPTSLLSALEFVAAGLWAFGFTVAVVSVWRRSPRARRLMLGMALGFAAYSVARLAIFARADYDRGRLPFLAIALAIMVAAVLIAGIAGLMAERKSHEFKRKD